MLDEIKNVTEIEVKEDNIVEDSVSTDIDTETVINMPKITVETDKIHYLAEMNDSIELSIENAEKIYAEQNKLISIVKAANDETLDSFVKEMESQQTNLEAQIAELKNRKVLLQEICDKLIVAEPSDEVKEIRQLFNKLFDAIGLFR